MCMQPYPFLLIGLGILSWEEVPKSIAEITFLCSYMLCSGLNLLNIGAGAHYTSRTI